MELGEKKELLIKELKSQGFLESRAVIKAFREVPRELFVPEGQRKHAYSDQPLSIGEGQTISAPHMVAIMTELLEPRKTDRVLEIGAGSGYQAAILSRLVKKVVTIELEPELAKRAGESLKKAGYKNVELLVGDGSGGWPEEAPYDKVIVTCACPEIPPALLEQLREGGKLIAPVGGGWHQDLIEIVKKKGELVKKSHGGCVFVPLRH